MTENYDNRHKHFLHSDRAAIDIGISALKTIILLNAGSLVTLLAFAGQVWNKNEGQQLASKLMDAGRPFTVGLALAASSFVAAYLYSSSVTALRCFDLQPQTARIDGWLFSHKMTGHFASVLQLLMIILAILPLIYFVLGMRDVAQVIQG